MHQEAQKKGAPKVRHLGRHAARLATRLSNYYGNRYPRKKIRNMLKNHTPYPMIQSWAQNHGALVFLRDIANEPKFLEMYERKQLTSNETNLSTEA